MAKFMDVHNGFVGVTAEQPREARQRDLPVEVASPARRCWMPAVWPRAGQFRGEQSR
jgi:hypothetical protein